MRPYFHNLYLIVKRCKTLTFEERLALAYKVSKGMCFLGAKGVLHRDLKPHNIMVDHSLNPFIIDFGSCAPAYRDSCFKVREDRRKTNNIQYSPLLFSTSTITKYLKTMPIYIPNSHENSTTDILFSTSTVKVEFSPTSFSIPFLLPVQMTYLLTPTQKCLKMYSLLSLCAFK